MNSTIYGVLDRSCNPPLLKAFGRIPASFRAYDELLLCVDNRSLSEDCSFQSTVETALSIEYIKIVASGRIDNIPELLDKTGKKREVSDYRESPEKVIALAYLKWGSKCSEHLLGDFAFSIWDSKNLCLFCSRDQVGMRPFYYSAVGDFFYFSSSLHLLLNCSRLVKHINIERVVDYITSVCVDNASTFYKNILRLPPAHSITVSSKILEIKKYWQFQFGEGLSFSSDSDYSDAFKEIFTNAVQCRISSPKTAISLSGGLDSTSVACVANNYFKKNNLGQLSVYSGIFNTFTQCDEREYINETIKSGNFAWNSIIADEIDPLESLFEIAGVQNEPWFAPHMFMGWNLLKSMSAAGVDTLLDGHDGDTTVSHGWGYFNELIDNDQFLTLIKEIFLARRTLTPAGQKVVLKQLFARKFKKKLFTLLPFSIASFLKKENAAVNSALTLSDFLDDSFKNNPEVAERVRYAKTYYKPDRLERVNHSNHVFHPIQPFALEVLGKTASAFNIDHRCPFWDRRLVEFCLSLPTRQKFQNGWPRSVLRRAMKDIIPPKIQWRPDKTDFSPNLMKIVDMLFDNSRDNLLSKCREDLGGWIDFDKLFNYYKSNPARRNLAIFDIWKILTLYAWLKTQ